MVLLCVSTTWGHRGAVAAVPGSDITGVSGAGVREAKLAGFGVIVTLEPWSDEPAPSLRLALSLQPAPPLPVPLFCPTE